MLSLLAWVPAIGACAVVRAPARVDPVGLAWPADHPRVRLERVIGARGDVERGGLLGWLRGNRKEPLFDRPYGVAWDGSDLLVADAGARRIVRIAAGRVASTPDGMFAEPLGIAACAAGIVVSDARAGRVLVVERDLRRAKALAEGLVRPTGVVCEGERVAVAETGAHRVLVWEADGSRRTLGRRGAEPGEFNFPAALALSGASLWVGDTLNFRVQRMELEGGATESFGALGDSAGEMPRIKGLALDSDGHLWVSDAYLDQIALFNTDGTFLMDLGGTGAAPGEFAFPAGISASPSGAIAVADALNSRVQVFRLAAPERASGVR